MCQNHKIKYVPKMRTINPSKYDTNKTPNELLQ